MAVLDLDLAPALIAALEDGSLQLHYQPEIDLRTGALTAMEGLLRWQHPERGLLYPADFLPVAAAVGLTRQIGRWVLRTGVAEVRTWHEATAWTSVRAPRLWLNVSHAQLVQRGFDVEIERLVRGRSLPPGALGLEFTEETLGLADVGVPALLGRLRSLGAAIGVDDFGTWYASLSTLDTLPLDLIKLDRRFLRAMLRDLEGQSILASIITMAHRRRMIVVAEGIETAAAAARLAGLGCDRAAGRLFCAPLPAAVAREIALGQVPGPWMRPTRRARTAPGQRMRPAGATA